MGLPATQWITVYNAHRPMKQRYHYNVANMRVEQHVVKGNDDGLFITSVACCQVLPSAHIPFIAASRVRIQADSPTTFTPLPWM
jgi:hypothetical protein